MLQRVVLNRPGLWSAVSAASVFTSRPSSYLTNSLGKLFPQESELLEPDTNLKLACLPTRSPLPVAALPSVSPIPSALLTNPHELIHTN